MVQTGDTVKDDRIVSDPASHDLYPRSPQVPDDAERLIELEIQLTHQQRITEQLSQVLTEQARQMDSLQRRLHGLENRLKQLRDRSREERDLLDEKPPHY